MAQDFTLRYPLVNGQGNFGSVMGMGAAAARYTEARLTAIAEQLMEELKFRTVNTRLNYDATCSEPVVLPARFPNLLVNGTQGIAVGMATSIPPHNLGEVIKACLHLVDNPKATTGKLMDYIKGPDFPLGGRIVTDKTSLRDAYKTGKGSIKVRGEWRTESGRRRNSPGRIVIHSVPYGVATDQLKSDIGLLIADRKLPQLTDLVDETSSESGLSIVLETKPGADPEARYSIHGSGRGVWLAPWYGAGRDLTKTGFNALIRAAMTLWLAAAAAALFLLLRDVVSDTAAVRGTALAVFTLPLLLAGPHLFPAVPVFALSCAAYAIVRRGPGWRGALAGGLLLSCRPGCTSNSSASWRWSRRPARGRYGSDGQAPRASSPAPRWRCPSLRPPSGTRSLPGGSTAASLRWRSTSALTRACERRRRATTWWLTSATRSAP
jgi:hypothetical protein